MTRIAAPSFAASPPRTLDAQHSRRRNPPEWVPLDCHPAFGEPHSNRSPSTGGLASWYPEASRLYTWNPQLRAAHRITVRLRDAGEDSDSVVVEGAVPSEILIPDIQINYEVLHIMLNKDGSSLLLAGSNALTLMHLHHRTSAEGDSITCSASPIASQILSTQNTGIKVLQTSWHPISSTHLGVLTTDAIFRLFDLSSDLDEPEQEFYLQPIPSDRCKNALSISPVAFSYGSHHLWDIFSVFILFSDGSIYILCPIVPFGSLYNKKYIQELYEDVSNFGLKSSNRNVVSNSRLAINWLEATFADVAHWLSNNSSVSLSKAHPYAPTGACLALQGPLSKVCQSELGGDTEDRESCCEGRALSFLYRSIGKDSVIVTTWSSGQLQIDALADEIQPHWNVGIHPRLKMDHHGHIKKIAMICDPFFKYMAASKFGQPSEAKSGQHDNINVRPSDTTPPLLRLAIVDLALTGSSAHKFLLFADPLVSERFYCVHGGGIDSVTLHFLPFSFPELAPCPPSVNSVLTTGNPESSSPFLSGFVNIFDSYGHLELVGITVSHECFVLEMKGWKETLPLKVAITTESGNDQELLIPDIISKEILAGPSAVVIPSSTTLRSLTADSIEGRSSLHHYIKLFHENYVEYAHKVFLELREHSNYVNPIINDQQNRVNAVKQLLMNVETKERDINNRMSRAFKIYDLLEKRLQALKMLPNAKKRPLSRSEQEFKEQLAIFVDFELDALRTSIDALNSRMSKYRQSPGGSPQQASVRARANLSDLEMSKLKMSLERLSLLNEENTWKLKAIEQELKIRGE